MWGKNANFRGKEQFGSGEMAERVRSRCPYVSMSTTMSG